MARGVSFTLMNSGRTTATSSRAMSLVPLTDFATKGSRLDSVGPHAVRKEDRVNEVEQQEEVAVLREELRPP